MSSVDQPRGDRAIPHDVHVARMRVALVMALRRTATYRRLRDEHRKNSELSPYEIAQRLGLVSGGLPASWAVQILTFDLHDRRGLDDIGELDRLRIVSPSFSLAGIIGDTETAGWVLVSVSPTNMFTQSYITDRWTESPIYQDTLGEDSVDPEPGLMYGKDQWAAIEAAAIEQTRAIVAALRTAYTSKARTVKAGRDQGRSIQIERLAFRLTRQAGRNPAHTDRRLCKEIGIDVPPWP